MFCGIYSSRWIATERCIWDRLNWCALPAERTEDLTGRTEKEEWDLSWCGSHRDFSISIAVNLGKLWLFFSFLLFVCFFCERKWRLLGACERRRWNTWNWYQHAETPPGRRVKTNKIKKNDVSYLIIIIKNCIHIFFFNTSETRFFLASYQHLHSALFFPIGEILRVGLSTEPAQWAAAETGLLQTFLLNFSGSDPRNMKPDTCLLAALLTMCLPLLSWTAALTSHEGQCISLLLYAHLYKLCLKTKQLVRCKLATVVNWHVLRATVIPKPNELN